MAAEITAHQHGVAWLYSAGVDGEPVFHNADGAGVHEHAIAFASLHHFGVAGEHCHPALLSCLADGVHHPLQGGHR